jgi:hypothetical protein
LSIITDEIDALLIVERHFERQCDNSLLTCEINRDSRNADQMIEKQKQITSIPGSAR